MMRRGRKAQNTSESAKLTEKWHSQGRAQKVKIVEPLKDVAGFVAAQ